jgi:opacity protein-like surface antigen
VKNSFWIFLIIFIAIPSLVKAQTDTSDLMSLIGDDEQTDYVTATFKTTRLLNGHSIENQAAGVLDFRINHRFGNLNGGTYEWFGLDQANVKIGFDYGVLPWLMVGMGHTNVDKTYDGFVKAKILRQSSGKKKMPISMTYVATSAVTTLKWANPSRKNYISSRYSYTHQLLIARKFSNATSIQIMPTLVHRNLIDLLKYKNDVYAIGVGGRQKLTQRMSVNAEYYYVLLNQINPIYDNSFSLGFDIETGGHVFQLAFTNSRGMTDPQFITQTQGKWLKGDVRFGFNVSRVFTVRERK